MRHRRALLAILGLAILTPGLSSAYAGAVEGRWRLVEQLYASGGSNLADDAAPLRLEFKQDGMAVSGRIWAGEERSEALTWPAFVGESGPLIVELQQMTLAPSGDRLSSRYWVLPAREGGAKLDVVEDYRVTEGGDILTGTVTVTLHSDGKTRGSYVLQRRFERER